MSGTAVVIAATLACGITSGVTLTDLAGRPVQPLSQKPAVFLFTRTDCPISNRYAPEIRRIHDEFASQGVSFWLVYVDPAETPDIIRNHLRDYAYPMPALLDPRHELVRRTGVRITPEVAVFAGGRLVYRGRVDDRYVSFGRKRAWASRHDLEQVLADVVAGRRITFRETKAVGCFIDDLK